MKEVLRYEDVVVYSDKDVKETEGAKVVFLDGSVANLEDLAIRNVGKGNIEFKIIENLVDSTIRNAMDIDSSYIEIIGGKFNVEIVETKNEVSKLEIIGTEDFAKSISVYNLSTGIRVESQRETGNVIIGSVIVNGRRKPNTIEGVLKIYTNTKPSLYFENNGGGSAKINTSVAKLTTKVNGSLEVDANSIDELDVSINGSGSIKAKEVIHDANIRISGSGNVEIDEGNFSELKVNISGSGHVRADVTVERAELLLSGSGNIIVKHVTKESIEIHQGSGFVRVNERG